MRIKLIPVNKVMLAELKEVDKEAYQNQIENLKGEGILKAEIVESAELLKNFFDDYMIFSNSKESLTFFIEDKKNQIIEIVAYNEKGESMNNGSNRDDNTMILYLDKPITNDCSIEILIENEQSVREIAFELSNIMLR